MKNKKIKGVVTTLALAGSLYAASASAGPFVDTWNYAINSGFSSYTSNAGGGGTTAGITPSDINLVTTFPTHLQWGVGTQQSAFRVGNELTPPGLFAGQINTNAAPVATVELDHDNFPVGEPTLVNAILNSRLTLSAFTPPNSSELADFLNFDFSFRETLNDEPCVATSPAGNPCNDIFVLDVPGAGFNPADLSLSRDIAYDGNPYTVKVFIEGLKVLTNEECLDAGAPIGCQGFTTIEDQQNTFQASLQILGENNGVIPVPEPSVLLLFGAGLCAMGWMKSRRRQA